MQDNAFTNKVKQFWAFIKRMAVRTWEYLKVAKMEWIVMICLFAADLISKSIVDATVDRGETVVIIPKFLNVHNIYNYAAAFGTSFIKDLLGGIGARIFFSVFAVAASVAFVLVLIKNKGKSKWFRVAVAMFVAGAMGNCIDRMFLGYVRDFIEFEYFGLTIWGRTTWYVFNIADVALVVGVIMIVIYFLFMYKDTGKKKEQAELLTDELGDVHPDALESVEVAKKQADKDNENCDGTDPDKTPDEQSTAGEGEAVVVANDSADGADNAQEIKSDGGNSDKSKSVERSVNADSVNAETVETDGNINNAESAEVKDDKKSDSDVKPTARRAAAAAKSGGQAAKRKPTATKKATTKSTTDNPATPDKDEVAP